MKNIDKKSIKILAIETSCDETAAAVIKIENFDIKNSLKIKNLKLKILSNIVSSQVKLHKKYGGVYPELASREHTRNIIPVISKSLDYNIAEFSNNKLQFPNKSQCPNSKIQKLNHLKLNKNLFNDIDFIAVTTGPGLIGSLLVGVNTAKTLSYITKIPIIPVNHLEGHIYANFILDKISENSNNKLQITNQIQNSQISKLNHLKLNKNLKLSAQGGSALCGKIKNLPKFPLLALVASGGHTSLIYMPKHLKYKIIGETLDDAVGEAFDKVAKMLGLGYPGGPVIDVLASKCQMSNVKCQKLYSKKGSVIARSKSGERRGNLKDRDRHAFQAHDDKKLFPRPMINSGGFNFSFAGLKTAVLYCLKKYKKPYSQALIQRTCYEFQEAVTDVLVAKTLKAAEKYKVKSILLGGGVAANSGLRQSLRSKIKNQKSKIKLFIPEKFLCTDNATVIGAAAAFKLLKQKPVKWYNINANTNLKLG